MRVLSRFFALFFFALLLSPVMGQSVEESRRNLLPDQIDDFRAEARTSSVILQGIRPQDFNIVFSVARPYRSVSNRTLLVTATRTQDDSSAFALLTRTAQQARGAEQLTSLNDVGRVGYASPSRVLFFKGATFVEIRDEAQALNVEERATFARAFAESLDVGANAVPPLVAHLPEWPNVQERAVYAVSFAALQDVVGEPLLSELTFNPATEAATAEYGAAMRLVVIEYRTPQLAGDNDRRISAHIEELRRNGQRAPSAYRRTGNYLVFVFNAPDEAAAERLASGVQYEQQITWLDENPFALRQAQRAFDVAASSLILMAFKFSGVALLLCLGFGTIIGGLVFVRRRAQFVAAQSYTDAGGMVRLNIDQLTPHEDENTVPLRDKNE